MTKGQEFISLGTAYDSYKGELDWQALSLTDRSTIIRHELDDIPMNMDIHEFVMGTKLRRAQFDGLRTVITRIALATGTLAGINIASEQRSSLSFILPHMKDTALGQELASLYTGVASENTSYRMGELEFLAQSGSRASPLDALVGLPVELQLQGIAQLLKPRGAFSRVIPKADKLATEAIDPSSLSFSDLMPLIKAKKVTVYASYSGSLHAASSGLIDLGFPATLRTLSFIGAPALGLIGALTLAWWLLPLGLVLAVAAFRYSRQAASQAVLRRALTDEEFFNVMRDRRVLSLETNPASHNA